MAIFFKIFQLDAGDQAEWNDADGWKVLDSTGAEKGAAGPDTATLQRKIRALVSLRLG